MANLCNGWHEAKHRDPRSSDKLPEVTPERRALQIMYQ